MSVHSIVHGKAWVSSVVVRFVAFRSFDIYILLSLVYSVRLVHLKIIQILVFLDIKRVLSFLINGRNLWVEILLKVIFYTRVALFWVRLTSIYIRYINKRKGALVGVTYMMTKSEWVWPSEAEQCNLHDSKSIHLNFKFSCNIPKRPEPFVYFEANIRESCLIVI